MSKIPTAKDILSNYIPKSIAKEGYSFGDVPQEAILGAMRDFARYHVYQAIRSVVRSSYDRVPEKEIDDLVKNEMKTFYPLTNIK